MLRALLIAFLSGGLLCCTAFAQTASVDQGVLRIDGSAGRENFAIVGPTTSLGAVDVNNTFLSVTAGPGCLQVSPDTARCDVAFVTSLQIDLGAGNDTLVLETPLPTFAFGGPGDDRDYILSPGRWGTEGRVTLDGGEGNDALAGGAQRDALAGGPGADSLDGGRGNDVLDPGAGQDTVMDQSGDDVIFTRDGERDLVDCGLGHDLASVDPFDRTRACELGRRPRRP